MDSNMFLSENRFRVYFEQSMVGMAATSADMRWLEVNDAMCAMLGYSREELSRLTWADLTHPDDLQDNLRKFSRIQSGASDGHVIENRFIRKDGAIIYAHRIAKAVRAPSGKLEYVIAVVEDITERKLAEEALRLSEDKFSKTFHNSPNSMSITRLNDGTIIDVNQEWCRTTGYTREFVIGKPTLELGIWSSKEDRDALLDALHAEEKISGLEFVFRSRSGRNMHCLVSAELMEIGGESCLLLVAQDISDLKQAMNTISQQNSFMNAIFESEPHCVIVLSTTGTLIQINRGGLDLWGFSSLEEAQASPLRQLVVREYRTTYDAFYEKIVHGENGVLEFPIINKKGHLRWLECHSAPVRDLGYQVTAILKVIRDVTEKKQSDELIWKQANFDLLTGLPNRYMFNDRLTQEIRNAQRENRSIAIFFIDLDQFKEVNDTLGHHLGDLLLVEVAKRISAQLRGSDTVARLGGDEFTVVIPHLQHTDQVGIIAQTLLDRLSEPFSIEGIEHQIYVSASLGITLYPTDATEVEQLLKNADQALYEAKNMGRNRFCYFTSSMQESVKTKHLLLNDLRHALHENQFQIHFQPIVDLSSGKIIKAEALLRWTHPSGTAISPTTFIPLAEESGMILSIGDWVFREATRLAAPWIRKHPHLQISINMSPMQFRNDQALVESWPEHLSTLGIPGSSVVVEITESLLLDAGKNVQERLARFRDSMIQVAIDDFGTGYSALSYLKKFDIDFLKIDRVFVQNLVNDPNDMALSEAIIVMAHKLGLRVIAEGVETDQQKELLARAGCDYAQGYLFEHPIPALEFEKLIGC